MVACARARCASIPTSGRASSMRCRRCSWSSSSCSWCSCWRSSSSASCCRARTPSCRASSRRSPSSPSSSNLEQSSNAQLRLSVAQLSSDLQSAQAARDDTAAQLADVQAERDQFRDQISLLEDDKALLTQTLNEMRQEAARNEELETELQRSVDLRDQAAAGARAGAPDGQDRSADDRDAARAADPAAPRHRGAAESARRPGEGCRRDGGPAEGGRDRKGRRDQGDRAPRRSAAGGSGGDRQAADPGQGPGPERQPPRRRRPALFRPKSPG